MSDKIREKITERVIEALEQGTVPWRKPWSDSGAPRPINPITGTVYTGINFFLLQLVPSEYNLFCTYKQAQQEGAQVKKGSKGLPAIYYGQHTKEKETGEKDSYRFMKSFTVFPLEMIEGLEEHKQKYSATTREHVRSVDIDAMLASIRGKMLIEIRHGGNRASYSPQSDRVDMPPIEHFAKTQEYYSTLFHELTHATGHEKRCKRDLSGSFFSSQYAKEELIAEMGSAMMCAIAGIECKQLDDNSHAYIAGWLKAIKGNKSLIFDAAAAAQAAVKYMLPEASKLEEEKIAA